MKFQDYIPLAMRTESIRLVRFEKFPSTDSVKMSRLLHAAMGLCTELGEIRQSGINSLNLMEELGDLCWYSALAHDAIDMKPDMSAQYRACYVINPLPYMTTMVSEFMDYLKRCIYYDRRVFIRESSEGHVIRCHRVLLTLVKISGFQLGDVLEANIAKLRKRYPERFNAKKALKRNLSAECKAMRKSLSQQTAPLLVRTRN